jgi:hypothetical protein
MHMPVGYPSMASSPETGRLMVTEKEQVENAAARDYLRHVIDITQSDATKLARKARLNPSTLTGFLGSKPRVKQLRLSTLEAVSQATGIPLPPALAAVAGGQAEVMMRVAEGMPRDVPVHGLISAPIEKAYYWNQTVADFAARQAGIARSARVFGLRMPDETMDGWRRVNEMVFVDPMRAVAEGDHAFVELANTVSPDGPSIYMIRRVVRRRPSGVTLATWGLFPGEETMPRTRVITFLRVLEWPEVVGM